MLDSSVLIEAERGRIDLAGRFESLADEPAVISAITASELLHGVHRARTRPQQSRRRRFVEWVLRELPVIDFGLAEARVHAEVWAALAARGVTMGAHDLQIAATSLALGYRLATANEREFARVPGLKVENWTGTAT